MPEPHLSPDNAALWAAWVRLWAMLHREEAERLLRHAKARWRAER